MPSTVSWEEWSDRNNLVLGVWNYEHVHSIYVKGYKNGFAKIEPFEGTPIQEFAEFVEGIFHPSSNFALYVCDMYHVPTESFKGIKFLFNGVHLTVTKENANAKKIYEEWKKEIKKMRT